MPRAWIIGLKRGDYLLVASGVGIKERVPDIRAGFAAAKLHGFASGEVGVKKYRYVDPFEEARRRLAATDARMTPEERARWAALAAEQHTLDL